VVGWPHRISDDAFAYALERFKIDDLRGVLVHVNQTLKRNKALDAAKNNTDASFAFARDLFGAKTVSEVIQVQTAYTRKVFDAAASQFKDFQELTQKFVTDATRPVTEQVEKTFREIKAA